MLLKLYLVVIATFVLVATVDYIAERTERRKVSRMQQTERIAYLMERYGKDCENHVP